MKNALTSFTLITLAFILFVSGCKKGGAPTDPGTTAPIGTEPETPSGPQIFTNGHFVYVEEAGAVTIIKILGTDNGALIVPSTLNEKAVTKISNEAAKNLSALTYLALADSITEIGEGAFDGTGLMSVWLPTFVPALGTDALPAGATLYAPYTAVALPAEYAAAIPGVATLPFELTAVSEISNYTGTNAFEYIPPIINGGAVTAIFSAAGSWNRAFPGTTLRMIVAPGVTSIGDHAFNQRHMLTNVSFPNATNVGKEAFYYCVNIVTANFSNVVTVGESAFAVCEGLMDLNFPKLETIGKYAFNYTYITNASLPSVKTIGDYAFESCDELISADFPKAETVGAQAFSNCLALTSVNFPSALILKSRSFSGCTELTNVDFPSVTNLDDRTFENCSNLSVAKFGAVDRLHGAVFLGCSNLSELTIRNTNYPASIFVLNFSGTPPSKILYVPQTAVALYNSWITDYAFASIQAIP